MNEPDKEPAPDDTVTVNDDTYTMNVGGLDAGIMRRHGWVPGEGLVRNNNGI